MCQQSISFNYLLRRILLEKNHKSLKVSLKVKERKRATGRFLTMLDFKKRTEQSRTSGFSTRLVETAL